MIKVIVSVFNNLYTDQRIEKICNTLHQNGYQVLLIGNSWDGLPEMSRPYPFIRIKLKSKSLKTAYLEFNLKLYKTLLKHIDSPKTILVANDLDTLWSNFSVSKKKKIPILFDSHEIFTEMPSVQGRKVQAIWRYVEKKWVPKVKYMMTASESYADWFVRKYPIAKPIVIQNFPKKSNSKITIDQVNHPKIILYQGAINPSRGLDKVIAAMQNIDGAILQIAGDGPKRKEYQQLVSRLQLNEKVKFIGKLAPKKLREYTKNADVGLSIEENNGESYYYSLPNKISDYIQARIPIVVSPFPEMKKIIEQYAIGEIIPDHQEKSLKEKIEIVLQKGKAYYQPNLEIAAENLCWENEEPKLLQLYQKIIDDNFS